MTTTLTEGQIFSAKYTMLHRIAEDDQCDWWLALDTELNERVFLRVFKQDLDNEIRQSISQIINRQRGLLHAQIPRIYALDRFDDTDFIASQYIRSQAEFNHAGDFAEQWQLLRQAAMALEFAHGLGFAHGHLHPHNLLIDNSGNIQITDFGISASQKKQISQYLSPQVKTEHAADASDDIYSFGQLLFRGLTGKYWRDGQTFESNLPIPEEFQQLLISMLSDSPYNRPRDLSTVIEIVDAYVAGDNDKVEAIVSDFSRVQPETVDISNRSTHIFPRERNLVSAPIALAGLFLLVILAFFVFRFLPEAEPIIVAEDAGSVSTPTVAPTPQTDAPEEKILTPLEIARLKELEEQGSEIATRLLRLQIEVEDIGGQIWAKEQYSAALNYGLEGDAAYRDKAFELALGKYQQGVTTLEMVLDSTESVSLQNQAIGRQALEDGDSALAQKAFTILNAITPRDPEILASLERAENLKQVQTLIKNGEIIERNEDLSGALSFFEQAYALDPEWAPAHIARQRIKQKIANAAFNDKMSIAFSALNKKEYATAREAFLEARQILPDSDEPKDGLEQITISEIQDAIGSHQQELHQYVADEDWAEAVIGYEAVLDLSPGTTFATQGLSYAQARITLDKELRRFVSQPGLMLTDSALTEAKAVLLKAARIKDPGKKLLDQINRLSHFISLARIPIEIELRSDNKTEVTVNRVRNFGKLASTKLELYPGTYTIVGKRRGYRDVREEVILRGGRPVRPILISCTEKI